MKTTAFLISSLLLAQISIQPVTALPIHSTMTIAQADGLPTPQEVQAAAKNITVRVNSRNNSGSGVIIAQKGANYLILTNAHIVNRAPNWKFKLQMDKNTKRQPSMVDLTRNMTSPC
jgi:hypothetical protein